MNTVLDASVALGWLVHRSDPSEAMLANHLFEEIEHFNMLVPQHWHVEIANGMLRLQRANIIASRRVTSFMARIGSFPIRTDTTGTPRQWSVTHQLALAHALTAYDATYLELAARSGSCLATFDRKLADAARAHGVSVFGQAHGVAEPMAHYG